MFSLAVSVPLVTVSFPPTPLPQALRRLSEAAGERLVCAPALKDEVLVARLKDADGARVLKEIAACLDARWEAQPSRTVLVPDPAARARRETAERKARADAMAKDLAEKLKPLVAHPTFGRAEADALLKQQAEAAKRQEAREKRAQKGQEVADEDEPEGDPDPAERANLRLAKAIGPAALVTLRPGEREVFAEEPTPMQQDFTPAEAGILAAYRREQALLEPDNPIARIRLVVSGDEDGDVLLLLIGLNAQGKPVGGDILSLTGHAIPDDPKTTTSKEGPLVLPKETQEYLALTTRSAKRDELFAAWRSKIADPVAHEPTVWYPGTALIAAAEARGQNLIGAMSDLSARWAGAHDPLTATWLLRNLGPTVEVRDGWIVPRPALVQCRVSRAEARALFAKAVAQGGLDVDAAADWCARYPGSHPELTWVGDGLSMLVSRLSFGLVEDSLALWGTLSSAERAALRAGTPLPIDRLPAASQEVVAARVYGGDAMESLEREPTELLPRGVRGGRVTLKVEESPVAVAWVEGDEPLFSSALTPDRYGTRAARQEKLQKVATYAHFRMGVRRTYTLSYDFPNVGSMATETMTETFFDPQAGPVDRLPDDFVKRADTAKQKALDDPDGG